MITTDIMIIGAGPVGLMCAYLSQLCGLQTAIIDQSDGPLKVGRADALNARTLQLLEIAGLFDEIYPLGKTCNTSSIWQNGRFISRQSTWWDNLEGCFHKHFLMLGQSHIESLLDEKLKTLHASVQRKTTASDIAFNNTHCVTTLSSGQTIKSKFVIGADGARSFVRTHFNIAFDIERPQLIWAVIDGVIKTDFPKVPEIIVFQSDTADVAWIPREGNIDRFYIRMDTKEFSFDDALQKINTAMRPHQLSFEHITWFSQFSVKESVAKQYHINNKVFLAGDACHIHSVNGGQGLNTGIADAFNLIWKLHQSLHHPNNNEILSSYESERKPVAQSVIETSAKLVRSTKYSKTGAHAQDYVKLVEMHAGNITGMGIRYSQSGLIGTRIFDVTIQKNSDITRLYKLLTYTKYTLFVFSGHLPEISVPSNTQLIQIFPLQQKNQFWTLDTTYLDQIILVRPDGYIAMTTTISNMNTIEERL